MAPDYYSLLDLPYDATPEEIRDAYRQLVRIYHPDANQNAADGEAFIAIQNAYEVLSNPEKKAGYDASLPESLRAGPEITTAVRFSRSVIPVFDEPQLVYALVELICTADINKKHTPPAHICLVLDRSTSMQGLRMDMVKASSANLVQQLRPQDLLSVVTFSDRAEVLLPPSRASSLSKSDHRISLLQAGGGTEILQGLSLGIEQLRKSADSYNHHLLLLTDGHTYGDEQGCLALAREAATEGISISVLGIGDDWNDELMDQIAGLSGGNAQLITSPADLDNFIADKLLQIETLFARGLRFQFTTSPGVQLRYAFRMIPNISPLDTTSPILLGDIQYHRNISLLLEFTIPPLKEEWAQLTLAKGSIWMEIPGRLTPKARIFLHLHRPVVLNPVDEPPPPMLMEAMEKLTLYRMQERVRREVGSGQVDKATRHLHYLATHLVEKGDRELAHTVLIEAEHVQQSRQLSGDGGKRIKYGTRALLLPPGSER